MSGVNRRSTSPLLARVSWPALSRRAQREQRSRERHTPSVSVYRWWARRPHAVIGAILDAACAVYGPRFRLADPFSGGATVAVEGARRRLPTYAQDLHPWAVTGLRMIVEPVDVAALDAATTLLASRLEPLVRALYEVPCSTHGPGAETLHAFSVRHATCASCQRRVYLFPYSLVTLASRNSDETNGYFGCRACGRITRSSLKAKARRCQCGHRFAHVTRSLVPNREVRCPHCRSSFSPYLRRPRWQLVLVQRRCRVDEQSLVHYDVPTPRDRAQARRCGEDVPVPLRSRIPAGLETAVLRRGGFHSWHDLYVPRQLELLLATARMTHELNLDPKVRDRLLLAICGAGEMAGRLSRWDRYYPKAFEALANHRYALVGLACETNPFASAGRGTLPRRLAALVRAARWMRPSGPRRVVSRSTRRRTPVSFRSGLALVRGSSEHQLLPARSIDFVLTDPPYFDDVQYSELASIFLAWAHATRLIPTDVNVEAEREAVPNRVRGTDAADYERLLTRIFRETRRVLRPHGAMVLTFHNTKLPAWIALARALHAADFSVRALAVVRSENETDHAKRRGRRFTKDLVLECVPGRRPGAPTAVVKARDDQDRELLALGRALAGITDPATIEAAFVATLAQRQAPRVHATAGAQRRAS